MRRFLPFNLTREQTEDLFDKAAERFLKGCDAGSRSEVVELHNRLRKFDDEKRIQLRSLQLRDHPLMKRKNGHALWPPVWAKTGVNKSRLTGEIGYLEGVIRNDAQEAFDNLLFLIINHDGSKYLGSMSFDSPTFCRQVYELLKSTIGVSIREIGDLDVSHLL